MNHLPIFENDLVGRIYLVPNLMVFMTGVWEFPLNSHYTDSFEGGYCPYMDQCVLQYLDAEEVFEWLVEDFERYYNQNRAPYLMAYHTSWFQQQHLVKGLNLFLDYLQELY